VFAIESRRTCAAIVASDASDGISDTAEETGGKESVIVPMFDCTISVYVGSISAILAISPRNTHAANSDRHKDEENPEIRILHEVY
jgi:hypothetical protein